MTQFSCIYCGRKLQIKGKCTYGRGRCPSCRHIIFIPKQERINEILQKETVKEPQIHWSQRSDDEIADMMKFDMQSKGDSSDSKTMPEVCNSVLRTLLPSYDEVTLFTLSFAFLLLYSLDDSLKKDIYRAVISQHMPIAIAALLLSMVGCFFSLINVLFKREKYEFEKYLMLFFAVVVTAVTGLYSGIIILAKSNGLLMIFPLWNIANAAILILWLRFGVLNTDCIVENGFDFSQILFSIISIGIILGLCYYVFELHWAISYSICACYTITFNDAIHGILGINKDKTFS